MQQPTGNMMQPQYNQPSQSQYNQPSHPQYNQPPQPQYQMGPPPPAAMWGQQPSQVPPPLAQPPIPTMYQAQPQQYQTTGGSGGSGDEIKSLWIGDLQYWMDENYVATCFAQTGQVMSVKLIRNKQSGQLEGYGFIEFTTRAAAEQALQMYNGAIMPNTSQNFRLNWASFGAGERRRDDGADYTLFVGDLAPDVTDYILQETFKSHYPSVKGANVVTDKLTGRPKGYGFVKFGDANEQTRALTEMQGMYCSSRPMRIGVAANKNKVDAGGQQYSSASYQTTEGTQSESDPNSTTIFVGGLDTNVPEEELHRLFSTYGELVHVKIPVGKRCGFVQFANRACAEEALLMLNGTLVGSQNIRLSWGRSASNKQTQQDPTQYNNNSYGYRQQGYNAYGYGQHAQNPNMYAYGAYPNYQQQANYQQQQCALLQTGSCFAGRVGKQGKPFQQYVSSAFIYCGKYATIQ